jgi:hypothetical protein
LFIAEGIDIYYAEVSAGQKRPRPPSLEYESAREMYFFSAPRTVPAYKATPKNFAAMQENPATRVFCGRPDDTEPPIPLTLLRDAFGMFMDDNRTYAPNASDYTFAREIRITMSAFYSNEGNRATSFLKTMARAGLELERQLIGNYYTDGSSRVDKYFFMITEAKDEAAEGPSDPLLRSISHFFEYVRLHPVSITSVLPCLLVYYSGELLHYCPQNMA